MSFGRKFRRRHMTKDHVTQPASESAAPMDPEQFCAAMEITHLLPAALREAGVVDDGELANDGSDI